MALHEFTLESLSRLDGGKAVLAFEKHLSRVAADLYDRPADSKARKVTMEVAFVPQMEPDGSCSEVKAQIQVKSSVPTHQTRVYSLALFPSGKMAFSEHSPDNVNQSSILDADPDA